MQESQIPDPLQYRDAPPGTADETMVEPQMKVPFAAILDSIGSASNEQQQQQQQQQQTKSKKVLDDAEKKKMITIRIQETTTQMLLNIPAHRVNSADEARHKEVRLHTSPSGSVQLLSRSIRENYLERS